MGLSRHLVIYLPFPVRKPFLQCPVWLQVCAFWARFSHICAIFTPELEPLTYVIIIIGSHLEYTAGWRPPPCWATQYDLLPLQSIFMFCRDICGSLQPSVFGSASISFSLVRVPHCEVMRPFAIHASHMPSPFPFLFHDGYQQLGEFGFFLYWLVRYMILPFDV